MSQYKTGTVSVTNGSQVVTGTGTAWLSNVQQGAGFSVAGSGVPYTVGSVDSDTQITLSANYAGSSGSSLSYAIWRDFTANENLPELFHGDIETATIWTRAMRLIDALLGQATTTTRGTVEKATASETLAGAHGKFPDAFLIKESYEARRQNNLSATTDPTVNDDGTLGYEPLSRWINTSTGEIWLCVDSTTGAANWQKASLTLDELGSAALADVGTGINQLPRNQDLPIASETVKGLIEKATTQESQTGAADKFPDAAGVHAAFNQYGLGSRAFPLDSNFDIDDFTLPTGLYYIAGALGTKPIPNGHLFVSREDNGATVAQAFYENTGDRVWRRSGGTWNNQWTPWRLVYTQSSILGVVSQSSGVPTGAIIEQGENSNGKYTKFADGRFIATLVTELTYSVPDRMNTNWTIPLGYQSVDFISASVNLNLLFVDGVPFNQIGGTTYESGGTGVYTVHVHWTDTVLASGDTARGTVLVAHGRWF